MRILWGLMTYCLLLLSCEKTEKKSQKEQDNPSLPTFTYTDSAQLIHDFFEYFEKQQFKEAAQMVISQAEYKALFPHLKEGKEDSLAHHFLPGYMTAANAKHFNRWLAYHEDFPFEFSRFEILGPKLRDGPITYHKGVKIFVKNKNGEEEALKVFKTLAEVDGKFKIWAITDD